MKVGDFVVERLHGMRCIIRSRLLRLQPQTKGTAAVGPSLHHRDNSAGFLLTPWPQGRDLSTPPPSKPGPDRPDRASPVVMLDVPCSLAI
jgi:hypothetical protein